ncbi:MAG TPA: hypothetical protein VLA29_03830 [Acidimicrobiia bacterium]|nr:hypothetical protein [Acidimicrobiia bacterium]
MDSPQPDPRPRLDDIHRELDDIDPAEAPDVAERIASELAELLEETGPDGREGGT